MASSYYFRVFAALMAMTTAALVALLMASTPASAFTTAYTVNSTADDDDNACDQLNLSDPNKDCTLREAIKAANAASGADTIINFNIPDSSCDPTTKVCTIHVGGTTGSTSGTPLPNITEAVTIDGYTQRPCSSNPDPCSKANTNDLTQGDNANLLIELDGTSAGFAPGLRIFNPGGPNVSNVVIKGLVINRFSAGGIIMTGFGPGNRVEGSFIGTDASGTTSGLGNGQNGVAVNGFGDTVGGTLPAARNVISGNNASGVVLGGSGNKVEGNYIGTQKDGTSPLSNNSGVSLSTANNTVGGRDSGAANVIASNSAEGVSTSNNANVTGNGILNNSIHSNGKLGIDLVGGTEDTNGVTKNDKKDGDTGPNNLQNYPVFTSTKANSDGTTTVTGKLNSRPRKTFTIQLFSSDQADPSTYGEGKTFLDQKTVKTSRRGNGSFTFKVQLSAGENVITATATNDTTGDTSEFSKARTAS